MNLCWSIHYHERMCMVLDIKLMNRILKKYLRIRLKMIKHVIFVADYKIFANWQNTHQYVPLYVSIKPTRYRSNHIRVPKLLSLRMPFKIL